MYIIPTNRCAAETTPATTSSTAQAIISEAEPVEAEVDHATTRKKLERKLSLRPEKQELVERNILKGLCFVGVREP